MNFLAVGSDQPNLTSSQSSHPGTSRSIMQQQYAICGRSLVFRVRRQRAHRGRICEAALSRDRHPAPLPVRVTFRSTPHPLFYRRIALNDLSADQSTSDQSPVDVAKSITAIDHM
jgi:hypothetical protein